MVEAQYARLGLTVDCVVFGLDAQDQLQVLLIQRKLPPFAGEWALPGGFVRPEESLEQAARRELREETGMEQVFLEQLYTFGAVERDPRDRIVSVAYYALVNLRDHALRAATDARAVDWFGLENLPELAFDHTAILHCALTRLRAKIRYAPIGFELLPEKFTLTQLQRLYEVILGTAIDKRNFRKKILKMNLLRPLPEKEQGVPHRAAQLYCFDCDRYTTLTKSGFSFEL
ncbi:NUDIX hydrolase [Leptolyngbya sp. PCC 6406]|uniref:NUDIX hydrolase n=1 Tax=Leptolyngbya sp. PCC 6406 TaxID=1173264 RepID=UPI0002AC6287|nr:NUDIX domain-containing protein [Leptolyngbya sp. PCC 6406]